MTGCVPRVLGPLEDEGQATAGDVTGECAKAVMPVMVWVFACRDEEHDWPDTGGGGVNEIKERQELREDAA